MSYVVNRPKWSQIGKCKALQHLVRQTKCASRLNVIDVPFPVVGKRHSRQELRFDVASQFITVISKRANIAWEAATYDVAQFTMDCICRSFCGVTSPSRLGLATLFWMGVAISFLALFPIASWLVALLAMFGLPAPPIFLAFL
jgi:hypothetical protein